MLPVNFSNYYNPYSFNAPQSYYWSGMNDSSYLPQRSYFEEPSYRENPAKTVSLAGLLQLIAIGLNKASQWCSNKLAAGQEFTTFDNVRKVANNMVSENKLDVTVGYINDANKQAFANHYRLGAELDAVAKGQNAFFVDELKLAVAPERKPSLILHELGHAVNAKGGITKLLQKTRRYAPYAPTALLLANGMFSDKTDGKKSFIERNAGKLGFIAFLPTIIEEGLASFRGVKSAKSVLKNPPKLNILKTNYALALCTYIIAGIGLGIASKQAVIEDSLRT